VSALRERFGSAAFESSHGYQLHGTVEERGLTSPFQLWLGPEGRYVLQVEGRLPHVEGCDGKQAFRADLGVGERVQVLGERDELLVHGWFLSPRWLAPSAPLGLQASDELSFQFEQSPLKGVIHVDAATRLPTALDWSTGSESGALTWKSWRDESGVRLPSAWEFRGGRGEVSRYEVEQVTRLAQPSQALQTRRKLAIDASVVGTGGAIELEKAPTGHLLVHPTVAGKDLGWFIFDTGAAVNVLSTPIVEEAGFDGFGSEQVGGVGGIVESKFHQPGALVLGPLRAEQPVFLSMDLAFLEAFLGRRIAGVIGYPTMLAGVFELDMLTPSLRVHPPNHEPERTAAGATPWQEMVIYNAHSCVYATFEGDRRGLFTLDTGMGQGGVTFSGPAVEAYRLLEGRSVKDANVGGVGGFRKAKAGTIEWLQLGSRRFDSVAAMFPVDAHGHTASQYVTGTLSAKLLEPFTTVFDYRNQRIAFVPREIGAK
jgi:hypothetical protein